MSRKRLLISVAQVLGFTAMVVGGLAWAAKRPPGFYTQSEMPAGDGRIARSNEAVGNFFLIRDRLANFDPNWEVVFTAEQLNAYFQEEFQSHGGDENLPEGFSAPRIQFEDGKMRLGLRYGSGWRSTIISIQVKVWLVPGQTNVLAMEIVSLKAGALPLSTGALLDRISQFARRENIDVTWFRKDGHPVAILRFQSDLTRPTLQFEQVELSNGRLVIKGRSADPFSGQRKRS